MLASKTVELDGLTISYGDSETAGPEVVFFHGYPSRWQDYQPFLEELAADFHVFAPSMRGMGQSDRAESYRVKDFMADMSAFIKIVMSPPVLMVGQGGGPWFAAAVAAHEPELFRALVSLDEAFSPEVNIAGNKAWMPYRWGTAEALRASHDFDSFVEAFRRVPIPGGGTINDLPEERVHRNAAVSFTLDPDVLAHWESMATMTAFLDVPELRALPGRYRGPVLFVHGDPSAPASCGPEETDGNLAQYPWADVLLLEGSDTFGAMHESPSMLAAPIRKFLNETTE
jgi:pimeloyl-ACP methyl ester carboxylesterase